MYNWEYGNYIKNVHVSYKRYLKLIIKVMSYKVYIYKTNFKCIPRFVNLIPFFFKIHI